MKKWICALALSAVSSAVFANSWNVNDADSRVSFVSVKKGDIGEVHYFKQVSGSLDDAGKFELTIPLSSVQTGVTIRDERMQSMLFEVAQFPSLTLTSSVDIAAVKGLAVGDTMVTEIEGQVSLHGQSQSKHFPVLVAKLSDSKLVVTSLQPVIVNASEFNLVAGIEKLREVAGLTAISQAVPVSFVLTLSK